MPITRAAPAAAPLTWRGILSPENCGTVVFRCLALELFLQLLTVGNTEFANQRRQNASTAHFVMPGSANLAANHACPAAKTNAPMYKTASRRLLNRLNVGGSNRPGVASS